MSSQRSILIEGFTPDEILELSDDLLLTGKPVIFRAGTAQILGEFRRSGSRLTIELAQIDGGGEGVLPTLSSLVERYARQRGLAEVEWVVHAVSCANPNLKLRRMLERRGFQIHTLDGGTQVYYMLVKYDGVA